MCCCHFAVQTNPLGEKSSSSCISRNWFYRLFICFPLFSLQFKYEEFLNCCRFEPLSSVVGGDGSVHCTTTTARNEPWLTWRHYDHAHLDYHNRRWSTFLKSLNNIVWPILFGSSHSFFLPKNGWKLCMRVRHNDLKIGTATFSRMCVTYVIRGSTNSHGRYVPARTRGHRMVRAAVSAEQWRLSPFLPSSVAKICFC